MNKVVIHFTKHIAEDPAIGKDSNDQKWNAQEQEEVREGYMQQVGVRHRSETR